ncbi:hypothetical protein DEAC_c34460 [Desulfosporosinus acididurans]|uniref:Uncharacterized protein n=1 Tax=Desulfosporosinus acididurans TaxID=476652 RepID=A0A0J1FNG8_9FIRM|nr:hypothetical protein DEAC_c34460 [Desulfosporosinus acididurans]
MNDTVFRYAADYNCLLMSLWLMDILIEELNLIKKALILYLYIIYRCNDAFILLFIQKQVKAYLYFGITHSFLSFPIHY